MIGRKTMVVTCNLCGSTFHGNIEPYCFDAEKDPHWARDLRKYQRCKWLTIEVKEHGQYRMSSSNKCCESGKSYDVPAGYPLESEQFEKVEEKKQNTNFMPQTLF